MGPRRLIHSLRGLRGQVEGWVRGRLWAQVIAGLALGCLVGFLLGPDVGWISEETAERITNWLALPGNIFLGLISMVLVPLVVGSIVQGLNGSQSAGQLRAIGSRFLVYVLVTTTLAAVLGIGLARTIEPGGYIASGITASEVADPGPTAGGAERTSVPEAIVRMLPTNPAVAMAERDMLAVVVLAAIFGIAIRVSRRERVEAVLRLLDGLLEIAMRVVKWAMFLTPWAVFGLIAQLIARVGISTVLGMTAYILTVLLAFSTSSSAAVMPLSIDTAVKKLRVPESVASLVIPLGATINMAGTALYQSVAIIFMAQVSGVELSIADQAVVVVTLVASSVGAPGTPGVGVVILGNIAAGFGIPAAALPLILGVDRILDMCRTGVNLTGCVLMASSGVPDEMPEEVAVTA